MPLKKLTLRAFKISATSVNNDSSTCVTDLIKVLENNKSIAKDRLMPITGGEQLFQDFLSSYQVGPKKSYVFGTMLRVKSGSDVDEIPNELLNKTIISQSELNKITKNLVKVDAFYFYIDSNFIICTLQKNITIKSLETYINWLVDEQERPYLFDPCIDHSTISVKDINEIVFSDEFLEERNPITPPTSSETEKNFKVKISNELLKSLGIADTSISQILNHGLVSARISIKFLKPRKEDKETCDSILSAQLKPVSELGNIKYKTKSRGVISGDDVLKVKSVSIELVEKNILNEQQLIQEIIRFKKELD